MELPGDSFFKNYCDAVDGLIENENIGSQIQLFYPAKREECTNCVYNSLAGGGSTNVYKSGGPAPFNFGNCPVCGGKGYKESETTEIVRARVYWNPKDWRKIAKSIDVPDGRVLVLGYMSDHHKIKRSDKFRLFKDIEHQNYWDYKLAGEPNPHGFGNRYYEAYLDRM